MNSDLKHLVFGAIITEDDDFANFYKTPINEKIICEECRKSHLDIMCGCGTCPISLDEQNCPNADHVHVINDDNIAMRAAQIVDDFLLSITLENSTEGENFGLDDEYRKYLEEFIVIELLKKSNSLSMFRETTNYVDELFNFLASGLKTHSSDFCLKHINFQLTYTVEGAGQYLNFYLQHNETFGKNTFFKKAIYKNPPTFLCSDKDEKYEIDGYEYFFAIYYTDTKYVLFDTTTDNCFINDEIDVINNIIGELAILGLVLTLHKSTGFNGKMLIKTQANLCKHFFSTFITAEKIQPYIKVVNSNTSVNNYIYGEGGIERGQEQFEWIKFDIDLYKKFNMLDNIWEIKFNGNARNYLMKFVVTIIAIVKKLENLAFTEKFIPYINASNELVRYFNGENIRTSSRDKITPIVCTGKISKKTVYSDANLRAYPNLPLNFNKKVPAINRAGIIKTPHRFFLDRTEIDKVTITKYLNFYYLLIVNPFIQLFKTRPAEIYSLESITYLTDTASIFIKNGNVDFVQLIKYLANVFDLDDDINTDDDVNTYIEAIRNSTAQNAKKFSAVIHDLSTIFPILKENFHIVQDKKILFRNIPDTDITLFEYPMDVFHGIQENDRYPRKEQLKKHETKNGKLEDDIKKIVVNLTDKSANFARMLDPTFVVIEKCFRTIEKLNRMADKLRIGQLEHLAKIVVGTDLHDLAMIMYGNNINKIGTMLSQHLWDMPILERAETLHEINIRLHQNLLEDMFECQIFYYEWNKKSKQYIYVVPRHFEWYCPSIHQEYAMFIFKIKSGGLIIVNYGDDKKVNIFLDKDELLHKTRNLRITKIFDGSNPPQEYTDPIYRMIVNTKLINEKWKNWTIMGQFIDTRGKAVGVRLQKENNVKSGSRMVKEIEIVECRFSPQSPIGQYITLTDIKTNTDKYDNIAPFWVIPPATNVVKYKIKERFAQIRNTNQLLEVFTRAIISHYYFDSNEDDIINDYRNMNFPDFRNKNKKIPRFDGQDRKSEAGDYEEHEEFEEYEEDEEYEEFEEEVEEVEEYEEVIDEEFEEVEEVEEIEEDYAIPSAKPTPNEPSDSDTDSTVSSDFNEITNYRYKRRIYDYFVNYIDDYLDRIIYEHNQAVDINDPIFNIAIFGNFNNLTDFEDFLHDNYPSVFKNGKFYVARNEKEKFVDYFKNELLLTRNNDEQYFERLMRAELNLNLVGHRFNQYLNKKSIAYFTNKRSLDELSDSQFYRSDAITNDILNNNSSIITKFEDNYYLIRIPENRTIETATAICSRWLEKNQIINPNSNDIINSAREIYKVIDGKITSRGANTDDREWGISGALYKILLFTYRSKNEYAAMLPLSEFI